MAPHGMLITICTGPTLYLIDKRGEIRYVHIGEGAYDEIETNIKALLAESYP